MSSLGKGLAEIDGILAGCEYLDQYSSRLHAPPASDLTGVGSSIPAYQRQETPDLSSFYRSRCLCRSLGGLDVAQDDPSCRHSSLSPGKDVSGPSDSQWEALKILRDGVDLLYAHFEKLDEGEGAHANVIGRLRQSYGDARGMRQSGLLTYKDILQGIAPEELRLEEIFAFSCLSYSLAKFLHVKGRLSESAVLRGLPAWRDAVAEDERSAFDFLARSLWPEAASILDAVYSSCVPLDLVPDIPNSDLSSSEFYFESASESVPFNGMPDLDDMFPSGLTFSPPVMACDPVAWFVPGSTLADQALDLTLESNEIFAFEQLGASGPASGCSPSLGFEDSSICPSLVDSLSSSRSPPPVDFTMDTQTPPPLAERLKSTDMFKVFSLWFSHMNGLRKFLWTLSGDGLFSRKTGRRSGFAAARQLRQFQDTMMEQFFAPLADVLPPTSTMVDILRVTKLRVLDGILSTLRDVEQYLVAVTQAFDLGCETRKTFLEIVLSRCLKVSRGMKSCIYDSKSQEPYSELYVQARLESCFSRDVESNSSPPTSSLGSPLRSPKRSFSQEADDTAEVIATHPPKKTARVTCHICGKTYSGHSNLSRHKKQEHRQGKPLAFRCDHPGCEKVCSRADNLKQHIELVHKKHADGVGAKSIMT